MGCDSAHVVEEDARGVEVLARREVQGSVARARAHIHIDAERQQKAQRLHIAEASSEVERVVAGVVGV